MSRKTTKRQRRLLALVGTTSAAAFAVLLAAGPADAVSTRRFILDDAESLGAGELDGTMVHSSGQVVVGAQVARVALGEAGLAASIARADDGTLYVGTGDEGKIFRVRGDDVSVFAETGQLLVASLVIGGDQLYAGTLPEGKVFRIPLAGGDAEELVDLEDAEHVWSLAWHAGRSRLFAATGPEGRVYSIDGQGRAETYFDSDQTHVMTLALDGDELYAGTHDDAIVYRIRAAGDAEVVYDFPGTEVTALDFRDGVLAVVANEMPAPRRVTSTKTKSSSASRRPGKGRVWRVDSDGRVERVYHRDSGHFTSVAIAAGGVILVGGGKEGRIFRIASDRTSASYLDVDERQILALDTGGERPVFATGDAAALYRVTEGRPREAL